MKTAVQRLLSDADMNVSMARRAQKRVFSEHLLSFRIDQILHDLS
jgi:hypothetical protein